MDYTTRDNVNLGELWRQQTGEAKAMRDALHEALLGAFDQQDLINLVENSFPNDADTIDTSGSADTIVTRLLNWAVKNDRLGDVVVEACDANEGNQMLKNFRSRYLSETGGKIPIYLVVASMLLAEIDELEDEIVLKANKFQEFQQALQSNGVVDWKSAYHAEKREYWRPPSEQREVITVIQETFARLTGSGAGAGRGMVANSPWSSLAPLELQFVSDEFFGPDEQKYYDLCSRIEQAGAIIIVDAISFFHPAIKARLTASMLIPRDNVSLLVFSPTNPLVIQLNQLVEAAVGTALGRALNRFKNDFDQGYEVGIGNLLAMQRWLYSTALPGVAARARGSRPLGSNRDLVQRSQGGGG